MKAIDIRPMIVSMYFGLLGIIRYLSNYYGILRVAFWVLVLFFVFLMIPLLIDKVRFYSRIERIRSKKVRILSPAHSYQIRKSLQDDPHSGYEEYEKRA